jgi:CheY-like chemotaxis protein
MRILANMGETKNDVLNRLFEGKFFGFRATIPALTQTTPRGIFSPCLEQGRSDENLQEDTGMKGQPSVLIVDRLQETREVLQTALERHGVRALTTGQTTKGVELARQHHPDLIVLDMELEDMQECSFDDLTFSADQAATDAKDSSPQSEGVLLQATKSTEPQENTPSYQPRFILLGNLRDVRRSMSEGEFIRKPYHYGPLIRRIEELLAADTRSAR